MVSFQYISDTHIEYRKNVPKIQITAPNIILLGDIGHPETELYVKFIEFCSQNFINTFVLFGNHEYYSKTRKTMDEIEMLTESFPKNVYFLQNKSVYISIVNDIVYTEITEDILLFPENYLKLIGTTLWANLDRAVENKVNDLKKIYISPNCLLTGNNIRSFFYKAKKFILNEIASTKCRCIILTHHATNNICKSDIILPDDKSSSAFFTQINEFFSFKNIIACINGHTHFSIDTFMCRNGARIKFLANCYGAPSDRKSIVGYNPFAVLTIL